ncbi:hypothetical protein OURE66S_01525 [Oligella ureolytica]
MQALEVSLDVIDRCQNHVISGSRVRRHCLHYDYRREKTEAWQKLGAQLEEILARVIEPPRDCRRLIFLREYDNENTKLYPELKSEPSVC